MPYLLSLDTLLTTYLYHIVPRFSFFDSFFSFLSLSGGFVVWGIILIILLILFEEKRNHIFLLYFIGGCSSTYLLVNNVLKNIFMRPRPFLTNSCPQDFSFPSTHAATAFAAAAMLSYFDKKRGGLYYFVAFLISFSRIYLGCHYLLDVIIGGLTGYLIVKIILFAKLSYRKKMLSAHKS
ncbi:MAG: phosphatase PAP2 family protein [Patescibacteria group bacterium]